MRRPASSGCSPTASACSPLAPLGTRSSPLLADDTGGARACEGQRPRRGVREACEALCLQGSGLLVAIFIPEITIVWSFMGSTVCMLIGYVLPAACYLALRRWGTQTQLRNFAKAWVLVVGGSVLTVVCTACTLMQYVFRTS
jgi:amino acid permease